MERGSYRKLGIISAISLCVMYLVMFLNVDDSGHVYLSLTRLYMSFLMVAPMAPLMILFMRKMYQNKKLNGIIMSGSVIVFATFLFLLRSQALVNDEQYMKAMIPHHSSAILTSKHADITDPEVKALSEQIIRSQQEEIEQMKQILERLNNK